MPAAGVIIAAAISASATGAAAYYAGKKSDEAAAAGLQGSQLATQAATDASNRAEAFQRQQAEAAWQEQQRTERANYEQNRAHEQRLGSIGELLGFAPRSIPDYVPGTDPHFDTGATPLSSNGTGGTAGGDVVSFIRQWQATHPASEGIGPLAQAVAARFPGVTRYTYGATPSNNELLINGSKYKVIGAENSPNPYWYQGGNDSSGPPASSSKPQSVGGYLGQAATSPYAVLPAVAPMAIGATSMLLPRPPTAQPYGSVGDMLGYPLPQTPPTRNWWDEGIG